jgi:hypothetical protein
MAPACTDGFFIIVAEYPGDGSGNNGSGQGLTPPKNNSMAPGAGGNHFDEQSQHEHYCFRHPE